MSIESSRPLILLEQIWHGANSATGHHSYERLNHAMQLAVELAVGAGLVFELDDFNEIGRKFGSRWVPARGHDGWYALAVAVGNVSAIAALEAYLKRPPFIADDVDGGRHGGQVFLHREGRRARSRLALGSEFFWKGERVEVTSFNDAAGTLVACSYTDVGSLETCPACGRCTASPTRKVLRRYTISPTDIKADRAERKRLQREAFEDFNRELDEAAGEVMTVTDFKCAKCQRSARVTRRGLPDGGAVTVGQLCERCTWPPSEWAARREGKR